ncbi:minor capsid protein [Eubacterium sp.]|uniref:minor capsid protein n=1 Tax=Eubacterium sp. TaxID=142586 RepID=UPI002FC7659B
MNSRDYWRKRELEHIEAMNAAQKDYGAEFARINERAIRNIEKEIEAFYGRYAEKEGISISVAKKKVSSMDVQAFSNKAAEYVKNENFSDEANEALRLYNLTMKVNRLELLKSACALELVNMGDEYQKYMGKVLTAEAEAEAKRQAGILGKTLDTTDIENAKKIVTGSWKNATFSERIWGNNASLKNNLNNLLTSGIIAGKHPTALARDLRKQFDVTRYEAERLMRTESSRIQGEIAISNYEADGVTEYEWIAEPSACDICAPLDGKRFKVKGAEVGNPDHPLFPMHPNCRCAIVPSLDREEYDAWLNHIDHGGTTEEWERQKHDNRITKTFSTPITGHNGVKDKAIINARTELDQYFQVTGYHCDGTNFIRDDLVDKSGNWIDPEKMAEKIKDLVQKSGKPVKIYSCNAGADGATAAQELADALGVEVKAPIAQIGITGGGEFRVFKSIDDDGYPVNMMEGDSGWKIFTPSVK